MSKSAGPSLIHVPTLFSVVEPGVYRCASPTASQVPFLASLGLKTILSLTPEYPTKQLLSHIKASSIDFIPLGTTLWSPLTDWKPIRDEIVKSALEIILDTRNHPVLLIDPYVYAATPAFDVQLGIHQTGCVVGALRVLQSWNFASILVEYRSHSGPGRHRIADEQYIELFDPDLINLPPMEYRATWLLNDHDDTDTDYSADEDVTIQAIIPDAQEEDVGQETPDKSRGDDKTIPNGEHVGVG